jgi:hypothetical protein
MSTKKLSAIITLGGTISSSLNSAFSSTTTKLQGLGRELQNLNRQQKLVGNIINDRLREGRAVDTLRSRYTALTTQVTRLRAEQDRLTAAEKRREFNAKFRDKMTAAGAKMTAAGAVIGAPLVIGTKEAKHYDTEKARVAALGFGDEDNKKAIKYASDIKAYGVSQLQKLELMRDAMSVFGDEHHAEMVLPTLNKMKFGNLAVFGQEQGGQNAQAFMDMLKVIETRGGLSSTAEFNKQANIIQRVISATGGRVGATEWRHFLQQAGLIGKGMDSEALFYSMEHLVQEMGGDRAGTGISSLYTSLYQGTNKTRNVRNMEALGLIGDKSKVIHDKTGQTSKLNPGALLGADLFRTDIFRWMNEVLLPQLAKKGITSDQQIMDTFGMIASNTVGTRFLAEMYRQREIIERKRHTNANAQDIDTLVKTGQQSAAGKELEAEAKLADLKLRVGRDILPIYTAALEKTATVLESLNKFTEANPRLTSAMVIGIGGLATALAVGGPLMIALAFAPTALTNVGNAFRFVGSSVNWLGGVLSGRLGLLIKGAAVVLALANAGDYLAGKFGIGQKEADQGQDDKNWERFTTGEKMWSGIFRGIEHAGRFIGMTNITNQAQADRVKGETEYLSKHDRLPPLPSPGERAGATVNDNTQFHFNITQQPGQSQDDLVKEIMRQMKQQQGVRQRSSMIDPVMP